ncbi:MAG: aminoacyl-tRNA hydrolase [Anaerovoracaceae bacterium]|nr:aminoacyl-tRNA hydrolase [Bacillota bacterium]MDY5907008.1 aminoacyl-tRNA hydrolase [Anaerovoracaceae bacterium]
MKIIAGLGNPGKEYENTKHNVGFLTIDILAEKYDIKVNKIKFKGLVGEGMIGTEKVILVKPQTYMNLSGQCIREIVAFYKLDMEDLVVIYDDIDLPMGNLRIRKKGSAGTHNGMRSIIYDLQDDGFPRVRVGIGGERKGDLANYVISGFSGDDRKLIEEAIVKAADAVTCLVEDGIDRAMVDYNTKKPKVKKQKQEPDTEKPEEEKREI